MEWIAVYLDSSFSFCKAYGTTAWVLCANLFFAIWAEGFDKQAAEHDRNSSKL